MFIYNRLHHSSLVTEKLLDDLFHFTSFEVHIQQLVFGGWSHLPIMHPLT